MMNKKRTHTIARVPLAVALTLALAGAGGSQETLSLQDCLQAALQGNLDLKRLEAGTELTRSQIDQAKSSYYPTLKASGTLTNLWDKPYSEDYGMEVGRRWTVNGGLTLTQPLVVVQAITGVKMARVGLELDGISKEAQKEGVVQQIATLYWTVAYLEENREILRRSRDNLLRLKETVQAMVDNGVARLSDVNTLDISIAGLEASLDAMDNQVELRKNSLLQAMGRAPAAQLTLSDKLSVDSRSTGSLNGNALEHSRMIQILEKQVQLKDMQESLAGQSRWPTVVAFAKYSTEATSESFDFHENTTDKFTDTGVLGVQVDFPIFDGMSASISKSQARIEKRQLKIDLEKQRLTLQADSANASRALRTAHSQVERQLTNTHKAEENFSMKELEYREQVASLSDLLTAENDVIGARSSLVEALYNEKTAELELKQVLGLLAQEVK